MGRRASSPARRPAAPPARAAPSTPAKPAAAAAPAKPAPQAAAPAPVQQGPGLMGMIAANVAGAAAGHVIGRGIADSIFGSRGEAAPQEAAPEVQAAPMATGTQTSPCFSYFQTVNKCLNENSNDISSCQWAVDLFKECKTNNPEVRM